jgi:uncharacterized protein YeaO (DUF488 family)
MTDEERGGDPPCWAHLLDAAGRLGEPAAHPCIQVRRVYEPPAPADGQRVLVDRLWPRGLRKEAARLDAWVRELAPSDALRRWYGHDPARWAEFARRYRAELAEPTQVARLADLADRAATGPLTLVCAARDVARSNAAVIGQVLAERLAAGRSSTG